LTAILAAVRDPNLYWTIESNGYCKVNANGSNEWLPTSGRDHSYLVAKAPPTDIANLLDDFLTLPPNSTGARAGP